MAVFRCIRSYLLIGAVVSCAAPAWGQTSGASGSFGARNLGGSYSQPASSFNGSTAARGAAAARTTTGVGGTAAGATTRGDATVGQVTGAERFLRNNRQPGQFVGSDAVDAQNFLSQLTNQGQNNNQQRRNNNNNNPNNLQNNATRQQVSKARVLTTIGFNYAPPTRVDVAATLQQRLEKSPRIARVGPITVQLEGRTAVLSGTVATAHDRELAALVARLEAGVGEVRNELQVAPAIPTSELTPPESPKSATPPATEPGPRSPQD
jgi:hypothetical protein